MLAARIRKDPMIKPDKRMDYHPMIIPQTHDVSMIERSKQHTLSLIKRYNLHAFTLRKTHDNAPLESRKGRKVASYAGYQERENATTYNECVSWVDSGGGIGLMGGPLEWWPFGFPAVGDLNNLEKERYHRTLNKYAFVLDIDHCGLDLAFEVMPSLANVPYVGRTDNQQKGKFLLLCREPVLPYSFKLAIEGNSNEMMFEVKRYGAFFGKHTDNGHYVWFNIDGINVDEASLMTVDKALFESFCEALEEACIGKFAVNKVKAEEKAKEDRAIRKANEGGHRGINSKGHKNDGITRHASQPLPAMPDLPRSEDINQVESYDAGIYDPQKWNEWSEKIPPLATLDYALHHLDHEKNAYWNGKSEVKISGHGGLHVNTLTGLWRIHDTNLAGHLPQLIAYRRSLDSSDATTSKATTKDRKLASAWAGTPFPAFTPSLLLPKLVNGKPYSWPVFRGQTIIALKNGQYVSDVFNFDDLEHGKSHAVQSGTGTGKSTAIHKQITNLIHAVPFVGQVKQFAIRFNAAPVYAGHKVQNGAQRHITTYDGLHKFLKAHRKGDINLNQFTIVRDECHHEVIDGFKDSETFETMKEVSTLCGRDISISGTIQPISVSKPDNTVEIIREKPVKPFSFVETPMANDAISQIFNHYEKKLGAKPLIDVHLNDKSLCGALVSDLATIRNDLTAIQISKDTEVAQDSYHMRIIEGDGYIDESVDVIFRTSIIDDGVDVFTYRPVVCVVISRLVPLSIEQAGARFRNNQPAHTYIVRVKGKKKKIEPEIEGGKGGQIDTFHMLNRYEQEKERLEADKDDVARMLARRTNGGTLEQAAQSVVWGDLLKSFIIKNDSIEIDHVKLVQKVTAKWGGYCHRDMEALEHALKNYGYQYCGIAEFESRKDAKARKEAIKEERKALREESNERVRQAAMQIEIMAEAENMAINTSSATETDEQYTASKTILALHDAGMTFEAAKQYTETAPSFNKGSLNRQVGRVQAAMCYHMLKAGAIPSGPSSRFLSMLFKWLERKYQAKETISSKLWADACRYAIDATGEEIARARFFSSKRSEKANADMRGRLLRTLADVERVGVGRKKVYRILSTDLISDTELRISDIETSKITPFSVNSGNLLVSATPNQPKTPTQAAFSEFEVYSNPNDVRNYDEVPTLPSDPSIDEWAYHELDTFDEQLTAQVYELIERDMLDEAKNKAALIKNRALRLQSLRYVAAVGRNSGLKRAA